MFSPLHSITNEEQNENHRGGILGNGNNQLIIKVIMLFYSTMFLSSITGLPIKLYTSQLNNISSWLAYVSVFNTRSYIYYPVAIKKSLCNSLILIQ